MLICLRPSAHVLYNSLPEARFISCRTRDARRLIFTLEETATDLDVAVKYIPPVEGLEKIEKAELDR